MTISTTDAAELKRAIKEKFRVELHFHDGCGGQFFSVDVVPPEVLIRYMEQFLAKKRMKAVFAENYLSFTVEERF